MDWMISLAIIQVDHYAQPDFQSKMSGRRHLGKSSLHPNFELNAKQVLIGRDELLFVRGVSQQETGNGSLDGKWFFTLV